MSSKKEPRRRIAKKIAWMMTVTQLEEWQNLLKEGDKVSVIGQIDDILDQMY